VKRREGTVEVMKPLSFTCVSKGGTIRRRDKGVMVMDTMHGVGAEVYWTYVVWWLMMRR